MVKLYCKALAEETTLYNSASWNAGKMAYICVIFINLPYFVLVLTYQIGIKNLKKRSLNFKGVQNQPDASQKHDRGQSFSALKFCHNNLCDKAASWTCGWCCRCTFIDINKPKIRPCPCKSNQSFNKIFFLTPYFLFLTPDHCDLG